MQHYKFCVSLKRTDRPTNLPIVSAEVCQLNNVSGTSRPHRGCLGLAHDRNMHVQKRSYGAWQERLDAVNGADHAQSPPDKQKNRTDLRICRARGDRHSSLLPKRGQQGTGLEFSRWPPTVRMTDRPSLRRAVVLVTVALDESSPGLSDVHITLEIWCCGYLLSKYSHLRLRIRLSHYRGQISRRRYGVSDVGHRGRPGSFQVVIPPQSSRIGGKTFVCPLPSRRESWYLFNQEHKVDPAADLSAGLSCKRLRNNSWLSLGRGPVTFL